MLKGLEAVQLLGGGASVWSMSWSAEVAIYTTARNIEQDGKGQSTATTVAMALEHQEK